MTGARRLALIGVVLLGVAAILLLTLRAGGPGLDRDELIARADAICSESNARLRRAMEADVGVPLEEHVRAAAAARRLNAPGLETTRRLAELMPEAEVAADYAELVRLRRRRDALLKRMVAELEAGDGAAAGTAQRQALRLYDGPIRDQAERIGLRVCGQPVE